MASVGRPWLQLSEPFPRDLPSSEFWRKKLRKLLANRGRSSARPVCLNGLQILADSRKKAASATFDKVRFIHKTNEFSLILTEKGLKNTWNIVFLKNSKQFSKNWKNRDNLNALWQALFWQKYHYSAMPRCFCFDSFTRSSDTLYAVMIQAMSAILQHLY